MIESNIKRLHSNLFFVSDLAASAEFYSKLGFNVVNSDDSFRIKIGDYTLAFMDEAKVHIDKEAGVKPKGVGVFIYVEVFDVDRQFALVGLRGIEPSSQPTDWPWGKREFAVKDPDGYKIIFYSPIKSPLSS